MFSLLKQTRTSFTQVREKNEMGGIMHEFDFMYTFEHQADLFLGDMDKLLRYPLYYEKHYTKTFSR